jgi:hypothetical protein
MLYSDFYNDFLANYDNKDLDGSVKSLMGEMGNIIATNRADFEDLLRDSGVQGDLEKMTDSQLVDAYIENLPKNQELQLGTSILINFHNKQSNMDGDSQMDDACVKAGYHTLKVYFGSPSENFYNAAGVVSAVAQGVGEIAKFGGKLSDAKQKKMFGALDMAAKQQEAKAVITQQLLAQRQAQIEAEKSKQEVSSKTKRTILIVGGSVVGLAIIGFILYKIKKK